MTAGEWSPRLEGRIDLERYYRAVQSLENMIVLQAGGASRRPGSVYVTAAKTLGRIVRLVPFEFSTTQAYVLEFGHLYIRFYRNNGQITASGAAVEVTTPYTESQLRELKFHQSADRLYINHVSHAPAVLDRFSHTSWRLLDVDFVPPPSYEYGTRPQSTLVPSATTGTAITLTANANQFEVADTGRFVDVSGGTNAGAFCEITAYTSQTQVTARVDATFVNTVASDSGHWRITDSPRAPISISATGPIGLRNVQLNLHWAGWRAGDTGKFVHVNGGTFEITEVNSSTSARGICHAVASTTTAAQGGGWTLDEASWSALNGYPRCGTFHDSRQWFASTTNQPHTFWGCKTDDYPNFALGDADADAVEFTLNTNDVNAIVWMRGTKVLVLGTVAAEHTASGGTDSPITPTNVLVKRETTAGSTGRVTPVQVGNLLLFPSRSRRKLRQFTFSFDEDSYKAPDLLLLADHLTRPVREGTGRIVTARAITDLAYQKEPNSIIWAPRDDGTLLGMTYLPDQNVVAWHRHILGPASADAAGRFVPPTDDSVVESVCVIPHPDGDRDQVWLAVARTIQTQVRRYIEYLDDVGLNYDAIYTDSTLTTSGLGTTTLTPSHVSGTGRTFTAGAAFFVVAADTGKQIRHLASSARATITSVTSTTVAVADVDNFFPNTNALPANAWGLASTAFTGLDHLSGRTVAIVGDGAVYPQASVTGTGRVDVAVGIVKAEIGLPYVSRFITMEPEIPSGAGTSQGIKKHNAQVIVTLVDTVGVRINGQQVSFRSSADAMDQAPMQFSGDKKVSNVGISTSGRVTIEQPQPLPLTVTMISGVTEVGA